MPKKVDRRARRTQIADALMRVAATQGLQAVSLRHVANAASVSAGMVQHYFRTKDEMMVFALKVVSENVQARLVAGAAEHHEPPSPEAVVRSLLIEMLPLDELRWLEGHVGLAFHAYAAVNPAIADSLREDTERMQVFLSEQIRAAQRTGEALAELDPDHAARTLLALVEGLSLHVLGQRYAPDRALATFDAHLALVFRSAAGQNRPEKSHPQS
ncbi:MAG: TetR/AcrR family transcriptional regulator [Pseudonocardiaceae bacterium]